MIRSFTILVAGGVAMASVLSGCATTQAQLGDSIDLGRDAAGNRCKAIRDWPTRETDGQLYNLTCNGALASRAQGTISIMPKSLPAVADADCGASSQAKLDSVGAVDVRRCRDAALGGSAVVVRFTHGKNRYRGAAIGTALAPLERALTALALGDARKGDVATAAQIKLDTLAEPTGAAAVASSGTVDSEGALTDGIALNQQSLFVEASRVLNDAISQGGTISASTLIELQLEAALADSNIQLYDAARDHFARAADLLGKTPSLDRAALLTRKLATYRVLDLLNRRDYSGVLRQATSTDGGPVTLAELFSDPVVLANSGSKASDTRRAQLEKTFNNRDAEIARYLTLDAQLNWARSVALLASTTRVDDAEAALKLAAQQIDGVLRLNRGRVNPTPFVYLIAQIERQGGRIESVRAASLKGDRQETGYRRAAARFDCAIRLLQGKAAIIDAPCEIAVRSPVSSLQWPVSPILAETEIERASLLGKAGVPTPDVLAAFKVGIDDLIASSRDGSLAPAGLETYLDLLADQAKADPASPAAAEFFRAVQSVGSPAIARQYAQLKTLANASGPQGALLRERADLLRELPALRYQIEALDGVADPTGDVAKRRSAMAAARDRDGARLSAIQDQLLASKALNPVDDSPIDLADLRDGLREGEVYFKIADVRGGLFGLVVGKDKTTVYRARGDVRTVGKLVADIQSSIRDGSEKLPQFRVSYANTVFQLIAGPAQAQISKATSIVYDPAGPIAGLPLGVLVPDKASMNSYLAAVARAPNDPAVVQNYSKVVFLGAQADIALSLSPRSFVEARKLAQSPATQPFIGLGDPAVGGAGRVDVSVRFGPDCLIPRSDILRMARATNRVGREKLTNAATAFGVPNAPQVTGDDFTDTSVVSRGRAGGELSRYQVIHFATHGAPEYEYKCANVPPALLTTVGGEASDGMLTINEVAGLDLNANLVVLSACDTAASTGDVNGRLLGGVEEKSGTSLDGLVRSFLAAHARAVMATYWNVSSGPESDELFRTFYATGKTASIGDSLKAAQAGLIAQPRYSHPYYWGAYFVVGDASKMMRSN